MSRRGALFFAVACVLSLAGCQRQLFSKKAPDTPYQRYMQLHGESSAASGSKHGGMTPQELRARLTPLDQR